MPPAMGRFGELARTMSGVPQSLPGRDSAPLSPLGPSSNLIPHAPIYGGVNFPDAPSYTTPPEPSGDTPDFRNTGNVLDAIGNIINPDLTARGTNVSDFLGDQFTVPSMIPGVPGMGFNNPFSLVGRALNSPLNLVDIPGVTDITDGFRPDQLDHLYNFADRTVNA